MAQPVDITATILSLTGSELPGAQGRSLLPAIDAQAMVREVAYTSRYPILDGLVSPCVITTPEWSYHYWPGQPDDERLYRLPDDPGQEHDLRTERPEVARELRAGYLEWLGTQNAELRDWLPV